MRDNTSGANFLARPRDRSRITVAHRFVIRRRRQGCPVRGPHGEIFQEEAPRQEFCLPDRVGCVGSCWLHCRFVEKVQDLLFGRARTRNVKHAVIGQFDHLSDTLSHLLLRYALPRV